MRERQKQERKAQERQARGGREKGYKNQSPRVGRSPALESLASARDSNGTQRSQRQGPREAASTMHSKVPASRMSFAVEETLSRPARPLKRLPVNSSRINANVSNVQRTGLTASWRLRAPRAAEPKSIPVDVISEDEKKKLAELEMILPRVPGKIYSWLLIIVIALLCIGLVMVYSSSSFVSAQQYGDASYFFQ